MQCLHRGETFDSKLRAAPESSTFFTFIFKAAVTMTNPQLVSPFRPDCLQGKVAIVTGGGSGICYEITRQLLRHGCQGAVICGRRESFLSRASEALTADSGRTCLYKTCDVRDPDACVAVVAYALECVSKATAMGEISMGFLESGIAL